MITLECAVCSHGKEEFSCPEVLQLRGRLNVMYAILCWSEVKQ